MNDAQYSQAMGVTRVFRANADAIIRECASRLEVNEVNWRRALRHVKQPRNESEAEEGIEVKVPLPSSV